MAYSYPYDKISFDISEEMMSLIASDDVYHKKHARRYARTFQVLMDQKPKGRLLELGTSNLTPLVLEKILPDLEVTVTHFDLSQRVEHKYIAELNGKTREVQAYSVDLESTPLPAEDETFDVVLCCEVLEHMEIDPMFMMSEINRVLKDKGLLILTTPNVLSSIGITKIMSGVEPYFYMHYNKDRSFYRHNYEYTVLSLSKLLKSSGFEGSAWTEDTFEDAQMEVPKKLIDAGFPIKHLGDNIFTVGKKSGPVTDRHPSILYADE